MFVDEPFQSQFVCRPVVGRDGGAEFARIGRCRELPGLVIKPGHQLAHIPGGFTFRGLTELPVTWSPQIA